MLKSICIVLISLIAASASAQDFKGLDKMEMKTSADYKKAEPKVKECATYILSHPFDQSYPDKAMVNKFLFDWTEGTTDFAFPFTTDVMEIIKKPDGMIGVYIAAMVKVALDNPKIATDVNAFKVASVKLLAEYCMNEKNKVEQTDAIKRLIAAYKKGRVEDVLVLGPVR